MRLARKIKPHGRVFQGLLKFFGIFFALTPSCHAGAVCESYLKSPQLIFTQETVPSAIRQNIQKHIAQLDPLLSELKKPDATFLTFGILSEVTEQGIHVPLPACYYFNSLTIMLSLNFSAERGVLNPMLSPIVQHEYGHAVFIANMGFYLPEWRQWYDSLKHRTWLTVIRDIFTRRARPVHLAQVLSVPYQELFADMLAITASRDPRILHRTTRMLGGMGTKHRSAVRGVLEASWTQEENHALFAPIRGFLWQRYLSVRENESRLGEIFAIIFQTMAEEIVARVRDQALTEMQPEIMNRRLLVALHTNLRDYEGR